MLTPSDLFRLGIAVVMRPRLWRTAVRQSLRLARRGWWKTPPFLPLPSPSYTAFRIVTQYGTPTATPVTADVLDYLEWCRDWDSTNGPTKGRRS